VFAKKKDGTLRTAIDYRGVNSFLCGDNQSIPNIPEDATKNNGSSRIAN
jgi:hypothetical protein